MNVTHMTIILSSEKTSEISKPYCVGGGDPAGPVDIGSYETFEEALKVRNDKQHSRLYLTVYNIDKCDYDPDTGFYNGLTEEEDEQL